MAGLICPLMWDFLLYKVVWVGSNFLFIHHLFLNKICIFEIVLSLPDLVDNLTRNVDELVRTILCKRTLPGLVAIWKLILPPMKFAFKCWPTYIMSSLMFKKYIDLNSKVVSDWNFYYLECYFWGTVHNIYPGCVCFPLQDCLQELCNILNSLIPWVDPPMFVPFLCYPIGANVLSSFLR